MSRRASIVGSAPCYQFKDRHYLCHADCKRFSFWHERLDEVYSKQKRRSHDETTMHTRLS